MVYPIKTMKDKNNKKDQNLEKLDKLIRDKTKENSALKKLLTELGRDDKPINTEKNQKNQFIK